MAVKKDVRFWLAELEMAAKHEEKWRKRAKKVVEIYSGDDLKSDDARFNILWSNTATQLPALYSATPKPVVKRRHLNEIPGARDIAMAIERALEYSMDPGGSYEFDIPARKAVLDYLLPGRMVARIKYHPVYTPRIREIESDTAPEGVDFTLNDDGKFLYEEKYDELVDEEVRMYHVPYKHYRQSPADQWGDVWWVAYGDNFLTQEEIIDQFGPEHDNVPLKHFAHIENTDDPTNASDEVDRTIKRAQVWEIWDREDRKVCAVIEGYDKLLMAEDDPYGLMGFFPQPEPALIVETPDSIMPIPEYTQYQCQAEELNQITQRIDNLVKGMKLVGLYPGSQRKAIEDMFNSKENTLVPVEDWQAITERGGLNGMIEWVPLRDVADAWQRLMVYRNDLVQSIFELTGISDIQRGSTDPRETKGAQVIKANFAGRRLLPKQQEIQRFFRDLLRIKAELIIEHFEPETIAQMANMPFTPELQQALQLAKEDNLRSFAIDIETDSTIAADEQMDKQGVAEFTAAMGTFLGQIMPIVQMQPAAIGPLGRMLLWMSRKFRIARDAEDELEAFLQTFQQLPDPTKAAEEAQQQAAQAEMQMKMQEANAKLQMDSQLKQAELQLKQQEAQAEQARKDRESQAQIEREERKARLEERKLMLDIALKEKQIELSQDEAEAKMVLQAIEASSKSVSDSVSKPSESKAQNINIDVNGGKIKPKKIDFVYEDGKIAGAKIMAADGEEEDSQDVTFSRQNGKITGAEVAPSS